MKRQKDSVDNMQTWEEVLSSAARLQNFLPEAVLVGGLATAIYRRHRMSYDHVMTDLKDHFNDIFGQIESAAGWKTARVRKPVLILGSLDGIETGIHQLIRNRPLETEKLYIDPENFIELPVPVEILRIKAMLVTKRNAVRDYLDCAAIIDWIRDNSEDSPPEILLDIDKWYDSESLAKQVIQQFSSPMPYDLSSEGTSFYKRVVPPYDNWEYIRERLQNTASEMVYGASLKNCPK